MAVEQQTRRRRRWPRMLALGVIVGLATLGLLTGVFRFITGTSLFNSTIHVVSYVDDVAGLQDGAIVSLNGVRIGNVTGIHIPENPPNPAQPIRIDMRISAPHTEWLREDSVVQIVTRGPMGDAAVNVDQGTLNSRPARDGSILPSRAATPTTAVVISAHTLLENTNLLMSHFTAMVPSLKNGTAGKLMGPNDLSQHLAAITQQGGSLRQALATGPGSMTRILTDPALQKNLHRTRNSIGGLETRIAGGGSIGNFLHDSRFKNDVAGLKTDMAITVGNLKQDHGAIGKMTNGPATIADLHGIFAGAHALGASQGSLARLTHNPELSERKQDLASRIHALVKEMRAHPGKFFRIHLDIF